MNKVTIHDIALELNVSFSTVARALNNHPAISIATKEAVRASAERLGYRQNKLASSLRIGRTNVVGVIIPSLHSSFFSFVVSGIEKVMNDNNYNILLYQSNESLKQEKRGIETFMQSRVDGIISSITTETVEYEHYKDIQNRSIPLILFDRTIAGFEVPSVTTNDYQGGFLATEHLIKQGYTKIIHITAEQNIEIFRERLRGYMDALKSYNLPVTEELIIKGKFSKSFGRFAIGDLINRNTVFDAVFGLEDFTAIGAMQELLARNIKVPEQVGVIGFGNQVFGELVSPKLSSVDQQTLKMGEEAAKLFFKLKNKTDKDILYHDSEKVVLQPILKVRESSTRSN